MVAIISFLFRCGLVTTVLIVGICLLAFIPNFIYLAAGPAILFGLLLLISKPEEKK